MGHLIERDKRGKPQTEKGKSPDKQSEEMERPSPITLGPQDPTGTTASGKGIDEKKKRTRGEATKGNKCAQGRST